jgi:hypothetical protein
MSVYESTAATNLQRINTEVSEVLAASIIRVIALMTEAARTSETSVNFYQTTRRNNTEFKHLHIRRRKNLKFHIL